MNDNVTDSVVNNDMSINNDNESNEDMEECVMFEISDENLEEPIEVVRDGDVVSVSTNKAIYIL